MRVIFFALLAGLFISSCGKKSNPPAGNGPTPDQVSQLTSVRTSTRVWAETCVDGMTCLENPDGSTTDGDSVLYAGIACLAGEKTQCDAVRQSQGEDGKLWRAPDHVNVDKSNSSSRDMLLGGLAYIVATKDTQFAKSLVSYIHGHGDKLCTDASDNRCDVGMPIYSEIWGTMDKIWTYIGLEPDSTMVAGTFGESQILAFESEFSPAGYQTHLPMVEMLIRQRINGWTATLQNGARVAVKNQPTNPFFEYVANGSDQQAASLAISECSGNTPAVKQFWTWQEDDSLQRWTSRNGWDCITIVDLLIGPK